MNYLISIFLVVLAVSSSLFICLGNENKVEEPKDIYFIARNGNNSYDVSKINLNTHKETILLRSIPKENIKSF